MRPIVVLVLALALALSVWGAPLVSAQQSGDPEVERIAGPTRAATAARLSRETFDPGVAVAYLVNGRAPDRRACSGAGRGNGRRAGAVRGA